jgi:hypothetical protein
MNNRPAYNPLYWLAALGAGGLTVSFFVYINFMVPHKGVPMATFDQVYPALMKGDWLSIVTGISLLFIVLFSGLHIKLLLWNIKAFFVYKKTEAYTTMKESNNEVQLFAIPLTLAMTINVFFVVFALFVPHLWDYVEYLFPGALAAFVVAGYYVLKIFAEYLSRLLAHGDFDFGQNNSLAQMLSVFAFTMVGVGFAAPAAMSTTLVVNAIGAFGSIFFISVAMLLLMIKLTLGFKSMFKDGIAPEATPTLWIIIPILTLIGISLVRLFFGFEHRFHAEMPKTDMFALTSMIISLQIIFGLLGYAVMKRVKYFKTYIFGDKQSVPSLALICPGVAITVFYLFLIQYGFVFTGIVDKYSVVYFVMTAPILYIHYKTVYYFFKIKSHLAL